SPLIVANTGSAFRRPADGHRHAYGWTYPSHHDHSVHGGGDARRVRDDTGHPARIGLRARLHDLGGSVASGAAVHPRRRDRRRHAGARPGFGRDHGRYFHHWERPRRSPLAVHGGEHHLVHVGQ